MSMAASPLESLLARLAGEISNQTLKLDPTSHPRLEALAGTRIRFDVVPPALPGVPAGDNEPRAVLLVVSQDSLSFEAGSSAAAHAVVSGTLADIARTFFGPGGEINKSANVRIEGDEAALQSVAALFRDLQPDLAEPLAQVIGRDAADSLIGAAEAGVAFLRSAAESLATSARKEARNTWLTDQAQESLLDRMDDLRLRIDRLDARVRLAEERASSAEPEGP